MCSEYSFLYFYIHVITCFNHSCLLWTPLTFFLSVTGPTFVDNMWHSNTPFQPWMDYWMSPLGTGREATGSGSRGRQQPQQDTKVKGHHTDTTTLQRDTNYNKETPNNNKQNYHKDKKETTKKCKTTTKRKKWLKRDTKWLQRDTK